MTFFHREKLVPILFLVISKISFYFIPLSYIESLSFSIIWVILSIAISYTLKRKSENSFIVLSFLIIVFLAINLLRWYGIKELRRATLSISTITLAHQNQVSAAISAIGAVLLGNSFLLKIILGLVSFIGVLASFKLGLEMAGMIFLATILLSFAMLFLFGRAKFSLSLVFLYIAVFISFGQ